MFREKLFEIGSHVFPITVDYNADIGKDWVETIKHVKSWGGDFEFENRNFPYALGGSEWQCGIATLARDSHLWRLQEVLSENGIVPADMRQLFVFIRFYAKNEVTSQTPTPIIATAPGSTWRCSHGILAECAGVRWDSFYHSPGINLGVISQSPEIGFKKGTRFLTVV